MPNFVVRKLYDVNLLCNLINLWFNLPLKVIKLLTLLRSSAPQPHFSIKYSVVATCNPPFQPISTNPSSSNTKTRTTLTLSQHTSPCAHLLCPKCPSELTRVTITFVTPLNFYKLHAYDPYPSLYIYKFISYPIIHHSILFQITTSCTRRNINI